MWSIQFKVMTEGSNTQGVNKNRQNKELDCSLFTRCTISLPCCIYHWSNNVILAFLISKHIDIISQLAPLQQCSEVWRWQHWKKASNQSWRLKYFLGLTRFDKIRMEFMRGRAHVRCFGDEATEGSLRWFERRQRRDREYMCGRIPRQEVAGKRPGGRPEGILWMWRTGTWS